MLSNMAVWKRVSSLLKMVISSPLSALLIGTSGKLAGPGRINTDAIN